MRSLKLLVACLTLSLSSLTFAADPIKNIIDAPVPVNIDGSAPKLDAVKLAIIAGCRDRGWTPVIGNGNTIIASLSVRSKHFAEVEISYTEKTYSIKYKSSKELDYDEKKQTIHRNYNKWVVMLSDTIQREFGVSRQGF